MKLWHWRVSELSVACRAMVPGYWEYAICFGPNGTWWPSEDGRGDAFLTMNDDEGAQ